MALAEIPYLKNRLMIDHEYERGNKHSGSRLGEQYYDTQRFVLKQLEGKIRKRIGQMRDQRQKTNKPMKVLEQIAYQKVREQRLEVNTGSLPRS